MSKQPDGPKAQGKLMLVNSEIRGFRLGPGKGPPLNRTERRAGRVWRRGRKVLNLP